MGVAKRNQAMVMSIDRRQMILLCSDGSWKTAKSEPGRAVGDVVRLPSSRMSLRWSSLVAAVLAIVVLAMSSIILPARQAMACLSVDGIPGVELTVNSRGKVLSGEAVTAEGERLLAGLVLGGQSLSDSVQQLLLRAAEQGILPEDREVIMLAVTPMRDQISEQVLQRLSVQATAGARAALQSETSMPEVATVLVPQSVQAEAKALGFSPGQYALALKATEAGATVDLEQLAERNVAQALKEQGLNLGQVIKQLQQDPDLDRLMEQNREKLKAAGKSNGKPAVGDSSSDEDSVEQPLTETSPSNNRPDNQDGTKGNKNAPSGVGEKSNSQNQGHVPSSNGNQGSSGSDDSSRNADNDNAGGQDSDDSDSGTDLDNGSDADQGANGQRDANGQGNGNGQGNAADQAAERGSERSDGDQSADKGGSDKGKEPRNDTTDGTEKSGNKGNAQGK